MAIETPWQYSTADGRAMAEGIAYPRSFPVPLNKTAQTYDVVGGGSAQTINPLFNKGMFVALNAKGAATKYWHGRQSTADVFYGIFGVLAFNPAAAGRGVKTVRMGGAGEPEIVPVPKYLDYTADALVEPAEYWTSLNYGAILDDGIGANIRVGQIPYVPVHEGGATALRPGQTVYAVDHWTVTVDPADVVETHAVGYLVDPTGIHQESGLSLWTISLFDDPKLPSVPIA